MTLEEKPHHPLMHLSPWPSIGYHRRLDLFDLAHLLGLLLVEMPRIFCFPSLSFASFLTFAKALEERGFLLGLGSLSKILKEKLP